MVRVFIHYKVVHCHDDNDNGTTNENLQREEKGNPKLS
jgi:hypothetical protein